MDIRKESGRKSKKEGHKFENFLAKKLGYYVDGRSSTKVDIYKDNTFISVKNPTNKNTQISLTTQDKFIKAFKLNENLSNFIKDFFGGNHLENYNRHRKTYSQLDKQISSEFLDFLNNNPLQIFEYVFTKGFEMNGSVNYLCMTSVKNDIDSVFYIDLNKFYSKFKNGKWSFNETTINFYIQDKKILHLQMKGSGKKYSNGYHGLQFHIHNNFSEEDKKYIIC
jgi:hypothetical protein